MRPYRQSRRERGGYLIAVLAVAVAMLTLAYLALAAHSSREEDKVEARAVQVAALYAAESGLVRGEHELRSRPGQAPPVGKWLTGDFAGSGSKFRLEVLETGHTEKEFTVRSVGQAEGENGRIHAVEFEANYVYQKGKGWTARWRGML